MPSLTITPSGALPSLPLPDDISEAYIDGKNIRGLTYHVLEAGHGPEKPLILLIHGFPSECSFSWIKPRVFDIECQPVSLQLDG